VAGHFFEVGALKDFAELGLSGPRGSSGLDLRFR